MTKNFGPYRDFEEVGWSAAKVRLSTGDPGSDDAARVVTLGQDYPLAPPPPVQFVLCFEDEAVKDHPETGPKPYLIGFREQGGSVKLIRATAQDVANGLAKLRSLMVQIARDGG